MTIREVSERYNIPMEILKEYETWARKRAAQKTVGAWQYDDADLERLSLVLSLHEMGFDSREVELYLKLLGQEGTEAQRIRMLSQKRSRLLEQIHTQENCWSSWITFGITCTNSKRRTKRHSQTIAHQF